MTHKNVHKILYIMNVDWDWIKQRPHFLAEKLSLKNDVTILYPHAWRRSQLAKNSKCDLKIYPFFFFPYGGAIKTIRILNIFLLRYFARIFFYFNSFDYIWISSPELFEYLPKNINKPVVYDLMDDVLEFDLPKAAKDSLVLSESRLIDSSSLIFCSSEHLKNNKILKFGMSKKFILINNAFNPFDTKIQKKCAVVKPFKLGYVGTISSWFDCNGILEIANNFSDIEIHLVGPCEHKVATQINHKSINFHGSVNHHELPEFVNSCDAMLMPFIVNELVKSVDPVKIYEYIYFNKPIISVRYPELDKFSQFINFYNNSVELVGVIEDLIKSNFKKKYTDNMRNKFLIENSWQKRANSIQKTLNDFSIENKI